jgi:hypothetical protein
MGAVPIRTARRLEPSESRIEFGRGAAAASEIDAVTLGATSLSCAI